MTTTNIPVTNDQPVLIVWIEEGDEIIHDEQHPYCDDPTCPCWEDASDEEYVRGMSYRLQEAKRRYLGEHL